MYITKTQVVSSCFNTITCLIYEHMSMNVHEIIDKLTEVLLICQCSILSGIGKYNVTVIKKYSPWQIHYLNDGVYNDMLMILTIKYIKHFNYLLTYMNEHEHWIHNHHLIHWYFMIWSKLIENKAHVASVTITNVILFLWQYKKYKYFHLS